MHRSVIDHVRLMRESTDRVQSALRSDDPTEQLVASRLLETPATFSAWECEHSGLMREVANPGFRRTQAALLKKAAFRLIHRKALFEYLRDTRPRGSLRRRIVAAFHPTQDYTRAVICEHGLYLRKACSFLCASHVGGTLVRDPGFLGPLQRYQTLYTEYFRLFCDTQIQTEEAGTAAPPQSSLLPLLKYELEQCRLAIMNSDVALQRYLADSKARERTGDTLRLPALRAEPKPPVGLTEAIRSP